MKWSELTTPERDKLIAAEIFRAVRHESLRWNWQIGNRRMKWLPSYSTDISAAWEVIDKMSSCYWDMMLETGSKDPLSQVTFYRTNDIKSQYHAVSLVVSEAICKAALRAIGIEIED